MNNRKYLKYLLLIVVAATLADKNYAQQTDTICLQCAIDAALQNNRLLNIKQLQVEERKAKVKEDEVKKYPSVTVSSTYQYNGKVGELVMPAGSLDVLNSNPANGPLPKENKSFELGSHNTFNAGVMVYQPVTQQKKIHTAIDISKTDVLIAEREKEKAVQQVTQAVEKLYYGLLINQKQKEEAAAKLELAGMKLYDVESALLAGKTVDANKAGLQANAADEEQNLLKLNIQAQDYAADLKRLTGLPADSFILKDVSRHPVITPSPDEARASAARHNVDISISHLSQAKSDLAIKAAKQSFLPDAGVIAGYTYQQGNAIFPAHNPYAGINFKWNIQDIFSNKQVLKQRNLLRQQASENMENTRKQVHTDIEKAHRKITQTKALITVAQKAVQYRTEELKVQTDRSAAGLNTKADVLQVKSSCSKAEADLYAALLSYRLAVSDLNILTGL